MNNLEMSIEADKHPETVFGEFQIEKGKITFIPKREITLAEKQKLLDTFSQMLDADVKS